MSKKMLINATHPEENRVAIVENGVLTELGIEVAGREPTKGNIYKAAVVRVESGLQAAFVDYGAERLGFLQIDEVNATVVKPDFKLIGRPRITDLLHRGQEILVQIVKEERGTKGAALTTYLSLAGRYMVLMPGTPTRGVSRKAEDNQQRKAMKKALSSLDLPENIGCIARTAALDQTREELERDYLYLMRLYENIQALEKKVKAPALIYKESNLVIRSIRDYFTADMDEVLIDDPEVFREAREFFAVVMPDQVGLVKLHQERRPIFSRYQVEEQIEMISRNKVPLPSGGSIVIDTTEALVAIDVNSGKLAGEHNVEATATRTNLEAAEEIARQLRLRDLGGLIVIDFIDMRERKNIRQVEDRLRETTTRDKARITLGHISQFGMLEMSRQRIKPALTEGIYRTCPHCQGAGRIRSVETLAISILRRLHAALAKGQIADAEAQMAREVASYLLNEKREELVEMERRYQADIQITGRTSFLADQVEITLHKREKEKTAAEYVEATVAAMTEKPLRPVEPKAAAAPAAAAGTITALTTDTEEGPGEDKKRKRKRKRKAGEEETAREGQGSVVAEAPDEPLPPETPADAGVEPHEEGGTPGQAKKKRRRRNRRKGGAGEGSVDHAEPTEESAAGTGEEAAEGGGAVVATAHDDTSVKKKRRRRRRKKGGGEETPAAPVEPTATGAAGLGEHAAAIASIAQPGHDELFAKKKRRRHARKKTATAAGEAVGEQTAAAELAVSQLPADAAVASQPATTRKRRPARRKDHEADLKGGAGVFAAPGMEEGSPAEDQASAGATPKPRKRTSRSKLVPENPPRPETSTSGDATAGDEPPVRKRAPRRKTPKTTAEA